MESIKRFFRMCDFIAQEAFSSMARSGWMSWLVVMTTAVSLSILGGAWLLVQDLGGIADLIGNQVSVNAYVANDADTKAVMAAIQALPEVTEVKLKTKEQGWSELQQSMKSQMTFDNLLDGNPVPDTLIIKTTAAEKTTEVYERVKKMPGVEDAYVPQALLDKLKQFATFIRNAGLGISGLLGLASLAVIMNTIRLAVMARRREIEIMHLVGASNAFIAWPFLLEGVLFGLFATILTGGVMAGWRYFTFMKWQELFPFLPMTLDYMPTAIMLGYLALIGMGVGALGATLSVRKHIKLAMAD